MRLHLILLPALLLLGACASQPATAPSAAAPTACNADAAKALIGQLANEANLGAVRKATGVTSLRSLKPGDAMTMDYRADRVNVVQDVTGKIEKISCG